MTMRSRMAAFTACTALLFASMAAASGISVWREVNEQPASVISSAEVDFLYYNKRQSTATR